MLNYSASWDGMCARRACTCVRVRERVRHIVLMREAESGEYCCHIVVLVV